MGKAYDDFLHFLDLLTGTGDGKHIFYVFPFLYFFVYGFNIGNVISEAFVLILSAI